MYRCAITQSRDVSADLNERIEAICQWATVWALSGVDMIQIREKDLGIEALTAVTKAVLEAVAAVRQEKLNADDREPKLPLVVVNRGLQAAMKAEADGMHLPGGWQMANGLNVETVRWGFEQSRLPLKIVTGACHTVEEAMIAAEKGIDMLLAGPVFEKIGVKSKPLSLDGLGRIVRAAGDVPVLALGGVTRKNAKECIEVGAAGVAAIRLFQQDGWQRL
jgi:thiamine-phosphate pyrophosphorylase